MAGRRLDMEFVRYWLGIVFARCRLTFKVARRWQGMEFVQCLPGIEVARLVVDLGVARGSCCRGLRFWSRLG